MPTESAATIVPAQTCGERKTLPLKIGVMGSASDIEQSELMERAHALGGAIARRGCIVITGACPGLPLAAACGAKQAGGIVVGISPALSQDEHISKYHSPTEFHDVLIFTGNGLMGREVINIRSSDIVVIVGGRTGTLGEFAIAYDEGKLIGVLTGSGGISNLVESIVAACAKETGSIVTYESDPERLIDGLLKLFHHERGQHQPSHVQDEATHKSAALFEDPVCKMRILRSAAVAVREWEGASYSFCSSFCAQQFDADPQRFVPSRTGLAAAATRLKTAED